eukprot:CAMPEP_0119355040 /NCGR_PEP_ID=MMETSP1334-20130426/3955_1 /TAXON_ID=127549 /ORGANISM="Calcidiscus leptoporus, Strain RCC1130" /LENGTH=266 /DNA_ID=CAMNT_0007368763 /DNA_START=323 /DNA_END=1123 /DNA_ORIENTATION=-
MIFLFFHIAIVRAATSGSFTSPQVVGAIGHFLLIALCTFASAASGAHFNPNITLATVMIGLTSVYRFVLYAVAQLVGAILGASLMRVVIGWDAAQPHDLGPCSRGTLSPLGAVCIEAVSFHSLLSIIGGIAFDPRQQRIFGPVVGPIFIAAFVGLLILASLNVGQPGYGPMLNWAQCVGTSIVVGEFNGDEWISVVGPVVACLVHSALFIAVPPSHNEIGGRFRLPLFDSRSQNSSKRLTFVATVPGASGLEIDGHAEGDKRDAPV